MNRRIPCVLPCACDALSAKLHESLDFFCVGTTSGGVNWGAGRQDYVYEVSHDDMLAACGAVAKAASLPVSGDLENRYGAHCRMLKRQSVVQEPGNPILRSLIDSTGVLMRELIVCLYQVSAI